MNQTALKEKKSTWSLNPIGILGKSFESKEAVLVQPKRILGWTVKLTCGIP
jgi:hypothetical protein